ADAGMLAVAWPKEYGGAGLTPLEQVILAEEFAKADVPTQGGNDGFGIGLVGPTIIVWGTEEQKRHFLPRIISGEDRWCQGYSEPDAGSDLANLGTRAVLDGDEWVINGSKMFITNAGLENCAFTTVVCLTDPETKEFNTILVPSGTPGMHILPPLKKMGLRSSDTRQIIFDDCRVPRMNLMGERGRGRERTVVGFFTARTTLSSTALGVAEECFRLALDYAKQRRAFKRRLTDFQYIQGYLVDMSMNIELSRLLRDRTARMIMEHDEEVPRFAAMSKYFCCETAKQATDHAVQIFGGMGFMDDAAVSRYYRDIRAATIADGTTEIQKFIIARSLGMFS
ncbi:MAG TPA: acyl-CoA dehydrogenase family protein, partial [Dehalococcoidia bacterium]|nr:acyl-CoA dehydrogenase family protein [Dehalococcoidia bacterium]